MSQKILKSDEVDLKVFAGRVLTLLGELSKQQQYTQKFLEERFHVPSEDPRWDTEEFDEAGDLDE